MKMASPQTFNDTALFEIEVDTVTHDLSRFGCLNNIIVHAAEKLDVDYSIYEFPISSEVDADTIWHILNLKRGDKVSLLTEGYEGNVFKYTPLLHALKVSEDTPTCYYCGRPLSSSLGDINCTNHSCSGRLQSRLYYYFLLSGAPIDYDQSIEVLMMSNNTGFPPDIFTELLLPWEYNGLTSRELLQGKLLDYLKDYTACIARSLYSYTFLTEEITSLKQFIEAISIPELTTKVVDIIIEETLRSSDSSHLFPRLAAYLKAIDENSYARYIKELYYIHNKLLRVLELIG